MRLLHIGQQTSKIADDIRAALTALGKGDSVTGGIALIGVAAPESSEPIDAVLLLPHSVILVLGVDLPGPALTLEAPLHGEWTADGRSLGAPGMATNPGSQALMAAEAIARRLLASGNVSVPVRAILAVGPYAGSVSTPDVRDGGSVRVLHPTPAAVREALTSFPEAEALARCTVEQARAILRAIDPTLPIQPDSTLAKEGFQAGTASARAGSTATNAPEGDLRVLGLGAEALDRCARSETKQPARPALPPWMLVAALGTVLALVLLAMLVLLG